MRIQPFLLLAATLGGCSLGGTTPHALGTPISSPSGMPGEAFAAGSAPAIVGGAPTHPRQLGAPEPIRFEPRPIQPVLLSNGTRVFLAEDRSVPLVSVTLALRTGVLEEPAALAGLAQLTGACLRSGGAGDLEPDALDELLESLGAEVSAGIGADQGTLSLLCRVQDLPRGLQVLKDILERPRFDEARLDLARAQMLESLRRRKDDPASLVDSAFDEAVYGKDSPWAREATPETLSAITRDQVLAFHEAHVRPCLWSIAASGDADPGDLQVRLEAAFGSLPRRDGTGPDAPGAPGVQPRRVILIPKSLNQATLSVGHAGPPSLLDGQIHPDRYALQIFNHILGGGFFGSRLASEVRVSKGLAYSVHSRLSMDRGRGALEMACRTRTEAAPEALATLRAVLEGALAGGVTEDEVARAKDAIVNSFVFRVATPAQRVQNAAAYDYAGLPADYLSTYVSRIQAVTAEDVNRVARSTYHPEQMSVVVCGDRPALEPPLSAQGALEIREP